MVYVVIETSEFDTEAYCFKDKETAYEFREKREDVVAEHVDLVVKHSHVYDCVEDSPIDVFGNDRDEDRNDQERAMRTLEKGTEGFLSVLDRLDSVSREDDFRRIESETEE